MSIYLFLIESKKFVKLARGIFILASVLYFVISLFWMTNLLGSYMDVYSIQMFFAVIIAFMAVSYKISNLGNSNIHPSLLFVLSFLFLILFGAFCLLLPYSSTKQLTFLEALFTSTSAVTVTGLAVLDTGKDFTFLGQLIILVLIQLGGLGILTITNIFSMVFTTSSSFKNRMMVSEMIKEMDNNNTFSTLFKIVTITLLVESIGAFLIYFSVMGDDMHPNGNLFFSVFHGVSAFCNAGFSTMSNSLYESNVEFNYWLQLTVSWLVITGGLGYLVIINHYTFLKNKILKTFRGKNLKSLISSPKGLNRISINTYLVVNTTIILLVSGTILFYAAEYYGTNAKHGFLGKWIVAFFNSTTARTAGFNNVDMSQLGVPAMMLIMALMWIGASPGSTGGGVKTTTFALAVLNIWNQILGKSINIVKRKEVPALALNQVNAVILLSIFAISFGTFLISFFNNDLLFRDILFECISAYSTVGLSLGITGKLTVESRIVIIFLMFLGRVSFLTLLVGVIGQIVKPKKQIEPYYPKENVFIN
ncbi:MAG: potassium transporter TrkG [Saprospiraceae bacterium]